MMMKHAYTPLFLVEGEVFHRMVTHHDLSIRPITRYTLRSTIIPHKLKKAETYIPPLRYGVCCVFISYDLWMSKTTLLLHIILYIIELSLVKLMILQFTVWADHWFLMLIYLTGSNVSMLCDVIFVLVY